MKHRLPRALLLSLFTLHSSLFLPAKPGEQFPPLTPQETSAIFAAIPEDARAKPQRPRKLLVFYRTEGFVHKSIPNANHALKLMGELTGAYTVTFSDDMAQFEPAALAAYDAVLFNNTSRLKFENPVHRRALLDFVRNGKGMIGIHAGSDNFPTWPEGQALMGGVFHSHPWVARDTVAVKNDDPGHILNTAFEKRGFWITEEIYQHVGPYSREKQRVLLSLDMSREENKRPANKIVRDDNDFGISWLKTEGKGRVFYTSLGHNKNIFEVPQILQHLLDGIQYALGDLEADAVPSAKLKTQPKPALAPDDKTTLQDLAILCRPTGINYIFEQLSHYEYGDPLAQQLAVERTIRSGKPAPVVRDNVERQLIALIQLSETTAAAKRVFLNWLGWIGTEKSIPTLTAAAKDPYLAHAAISALAALNTPNANSVLSSLLNQDNTEFTRVEAANAYGQRRPSYCPDALAENANVSTTLYSIAALEAFANSSGIETIQTLRDYTLDDPQTLPRIRALLAATDNALRRAPAEQTDSLRAQAIKIYAEILGTTTAPVARIETAQALVTLDPVNPALFQFPIDADPRLRNIIAIGMATSGNSDAIKILTTRFADIPADTLSRMMRSLVTNPSPVALPLIDLALASENLDAQLAAIAAAGACGNEKTVGKLFLLLLSKNKDISSAAFTALTQLPDCDGKTNIELHKELYEFRDINSKKKHWAPSLPQNLLILAHRQYRDVFIQALGNIEFDPIRTTAREALGRLEREGDAQATLRAAAFEAVALLVRPGDFPEIIALSEYIKRPADRREWTKALYTSAAIHPAPAEAVALIEKQLNAAKPADRAALIAALTMIDAPEAKAVLHSMLTSPDIDARKETIRALSSARGETAYELLLERITAAPGESERLLAQRGAIDTVDHLAIHANDKVKAYRKLWKTAQTQEARDAIIAAVKNLGNSSAKKFLKEISQNEK
ncbi:type 1 glutamine amidotransferase/HEAT repeat protein [Ereboglobus sp. PH5-10]|uniref:ThuA domain-containing protein n=1 Tax=Ereboglobus sp. PH5-10 TaxID=2940629 RepID=UPI00240690C3|nr:ThuA domain-containing protein [Ereboglobus sp. PH5-10]MDF9828501.1 type 1 glutamine amidotransferase/HEAT repeat protein [Ereboglobus sp. PH5-10]